MRSPFLAFTALLTRRLVKNHLPYLAWQRRFRQTNWFPKWTIIQISCFISSLLTPIKSETFIFAFVVPIHFNLIITWALNFGQRANILKAKRHLADILNYVSKCT